jgi:diaminopimelate epimerase
MMPFDFYKIHGTGNDFIVVDNRENTFPGKTPSFVKSICQAHTGIGADGLLLLEKSSLAHYRMRYFNSDGYEAEMCANGSRCCSYIAHKLGVIDKKHTFEAGDGIHSGEILDKKRVKVEVKFNEADDLRTFPVDFKLLNSISFMEFLNTGVPHLVLSCENIESVPLTDVGKRLRFHPYYAPEGTNVNFVKAIENRNAVSLNVRTFERGVDAETLSCGSGVTASAISFFKRYKPDSNRIEVETRGGKLFVTLSKSLELIYLEGPVNLIFKGTYIEEDIQ